MIACEWHQGATAQLSKHFNFCLLRNPDRLESAKSQEFMGSAPEVPTHVYDAYAKGKDLYADPTDIHSVVHHRIP